MKELLLTVTTAFTIALLSVSSGMAYGGNPETPERGNHTSITRINKAKLVVEAKAEKLREIKLQENSDKVQAAIKKLNIHVGKTWYVFSGATPRGWDCSGLTMWFYQQLEIDLEHRASKQDTAGTKSKDPKPGDLVVFHYKGNKDAYHVGIYIGDGEMIHAPKRGHLTRIENVESFGGDYSDITYRRMIETI